MPRPPATPTRRALLLGAAALPLAACSGQSPGAGAAATTPDFGVATRNNMQVHMGRGAALQHLGERFAREVPTTINFAFDSTALDAQARGILDRQADFMRTFPEVRFSVYGHTDLVGSAAYNRGLGRRRARAAVAYLAARGVSRNRLEALVSLGETDPVVPTRERERANRRTVTRVTGFLRGHPRVLDGKYAQIVYRQYVASAQ